MQRVEKFLINFSNQSEVEHEVKVRDLLAPACGADRVRPDFFSDFATPASAPNQEHCHHLSRKPVAR